MSYLLDNCHWLCWNVLSTDLLHASTSDFKKKIKSYTLSLILHQSCRNWKGKNRNGWHKVSTGLHEVEFGKPQMYSWILTLPVLLGYAQTKLQRDSWLKVLLSDYKLHHQGLGPAGIMTQSPWCRQSSSTSSSLQASGTHCWPLVSSSYCMPTPDSPAAASGSRNGARSSPSSCLYALPVSGLTVPYLCLEPWFGGLTSERGK